ncbi:acyl-CoA dehydrogenase [Chthonobacter rhizosphaerae]|uniref:acyl-CoA dehydrogenase n=1 Tax=Chthonobacter rhizosphaerae TaxID=2735553 RepID=UPI0015EE8C8B|nr:acyl-CoA dehydrogenase [Chthonobacter rhizosphaerae]
MSYTAPVADIAFWLRSVAGLDAAMAAGLHPDLTPDLVDAVLTEAGRFAGEEIAPLDRVGDTVGARLVDGAVRMPDGWADVYRRWTEGGWNALSGPPGHGGQGLPISLYAAVLEMWNGANVSFATGPMLTHGACVALEAYGTDEQKALYLEKLVSGAWTGTMNLTEPQAGSDLGALRTRAEPAGDGTYRITGQKIYITYGDHDLTDNIIHMVLARLPDAPPGTRGISLFLVPKRLLDETGAPGAMNDITVAGVEHKMGLHGSPTCTLSYGDRGGAVGWLVGEPNRGLAAMFTMMNSARLSVAVQGVGVAERATQRAVAYALDRRQGRAPGWTDEGMSPIVHHPDVKRMLLTMRAMTDAARAICLALAHAIDRSAAGAETDRALAADRAALLTPVAKAFATDVGVEVASLGIQVHGGMGFIEETGAAQHLRDARVLPIYEGTNGIQAIDLVTRKLPLSGGDALRAYLAELRAVVEDARALGDPEVTGIAERVGPALDDLFFAANWLGRALADGRQTDALAGATAFLRLFALAAGGAYHLKAVVADASARTDSPAARRRRLTARFFATDILPATGALRGAVTAGAAVVDALSPDLLTA